MLSALLHNFGQTYYTYTSPTTTTTQPSTGFWVTYIIVVLVICVVMFAAMWKIFTKAGKPGWAVLIPIYNTYVMLKIAGRPGWWLLLFFIPFVNFIISIVVYNDIAKAFGKGVGMTILMVLLPFIGFPVLAFGKNQYTAPVR